MLGCGNYDEDKFWTNPQYCLTLTLENDTDDKVSMIVSLMQTEYVQKRAKSRDGAWENAYDAINFSVYKVKNKYLDENSDHKAADRKYGKKELKEIFSFDEYLYQRELAIRLDLDPGIYVWKKIFVCYFLLLDYKLIFLNRL